MLLPRECMLCLGCLSVLMSEVVSQDLEVCCVLQCVCKDVVLPHHWLKRPFFAGLEGLA